MTVTTLSASVGDEIVRRKVTASGVIWLDGQAYYVSRRLAGRTILIRLSGGKLLVETAIPLRKEYSLPSGFRGAARRPRGGRNAAAGV